MLQEINFKQPETDFLINQGKLTLKGIPERHQLLVGQRNAAINQLFYRSQENDQNNIEAGVAATMISARGLGQTLEFVQQNSEHLDNLSSEISSLIPPGTFFGTTASNIVVIISKGITAAGIASNIGLAINHWISKYDKDDNENGPSTTLLAVELSALGVITLTTMYLWYKHNTYETPVKTQEKLSQEDITDTQALIKLFRAWKEAQEAHEPDAKQQEQECLKHFQSLDQRVFNKTQVSRERWGSALAATLPSYKERFHAAHQVATPRKNEVQNSSRERFRKINSINSPRRSRDIDTAEGTDVLQTTPLEELIGGSKPLEFLIYENVCFSGSGDNLDHRQNAQLEKQFPPLRVSNGRTN